MASVAEQAYAPYLERLNGQRPAPMDANYDALVTEAEAWVAEVEREVVGFLILVAESDTGSRSPAGRVTPMERPHWSCCQPPRRALRLAEAYSW